MLNAQLIEILILAMVAGIILFRLYTVLGRRTGHDQPPQDHFSAGGGARPRDGTVALPDRTGQHAEAIIEKPSDPVERGLLNIQLADKHFDKDHFLSGARQAYEMIVTAFAKGDRSALKPLLSADVFAAFDEALRARESRKERVDFTFVGTKSIGISDASLKGRFAEVTVAFAAQFVSATLDSAGTLVDGDTQKVRDVTDVWVFERDVRSSNPNWTLVSTSGKEP